MSFKPIDFLLRVGTRGKPRSWSIVFRLALLFTIAAAGMLLVAMGAAYWVVVQHVDHDNDRYLTDKLAAIRADMLADFFLQGDRRSTKVLLIPVACE